MVSVGSGEQATARLYVRTKPRADGPTCIDLFSGAGGLAAGFRRAGWSIISGTDFDKAAGATFRLNFPEASFFEGPISTVDPEALLSDAGLKSGELDCLIGGPPCQSFSYNNHQRSASDVRANLFRDYLRIVEVLKPRSLLMENVPGMLTIGDGAVIGEIKKALGELGYFCAVRILYAEDFGVPQARRRVFVIASRESDPDSVFPAGTHGPSVKPSEKSNPHVHRWTKPARGEAKPFVTVWDAIGDLPKLGGGGGLKVAKYAKPATSAFLRDVRGKGRTRVYNHLCHALSEKMLERIELVPEGKNWRAIPFDMLPAGMKRARESDHTKRYGRLSRKGLASTILTKCDPHWGAYVHPIEHRTITVREAARLQGFPDSFRFAGEHISRHYQQVGNAVPVPLARALGSALRRHLAAADKKKAIDEGGHRSRQRSAA